MKQKRIILLLMITMLTLFLMACSNKNNAQTVSSNVEEKPIIKIGTTSIFIDILEAAKEDFERLSGRKLEVILFDDIIAPNIALAEGSIDVNFYQHIPYLEAFNRDRGTKLVRYGGRGIACTFGIYSNNLKSLNELQNGAKIGIANDSSNRTRGLRFLESKDLIKIKEGVALPTKLDIMENPKSLEIIELDGTILISSMKDLDAVVGYGIRMLLGGKDPKSAIAFDNEEDTKKYADVIVLREDNKDVEWAKYLEEALTNERSRKLLEEKFQGAYIPVY